MGYAYTGVLPDTMQAVMCYGPHDYRLETRPVPKPGPGEVVVRVKMAGICASDLKCYHGAPLFWGDGRNPGYCQPPVTPGHEFLGEVVALGERAGEKYGLALGDRAISEQIVPCGHCRYCQSGQYWMCPNGDVYGFRQGAWGAMAEYMLFPVQALNHKIPDTLTDDQAVFIEPLSCSIHAVDRGDIQPGDVVVIAGAGPLGLGMVAAARLKNPRTLIALDVNEDRLAVARLCGADLTFNPAKDNVQDEVLALTDGYGCDVYIEASGHPSAVQQGLDMVRRLGTFVEFSVFKDPTTVNWTVIGDTKELNIHGSHLGPYCYPRAIQMLGKGLLPIEQIVTHQFPLSGFQQAIELVSSATESIKVALVP
jgi:threonine dehydrogenase-like Zn-dependent dehydrogenase